MALRIKPHHLRLRSVSQSTTDAGEALTPAYAPDGSDIVCHVKAESNDTVFRLFGVEVREARQIYCETSDAALFEIGLLLWWVEGAEWLKVVARPLPRLAHARTAHAVVLAQRATLREGAPA